jgi:hypothetical protein
MDGFIKLYIYHVYSVLFLNMLKGLKFSASTLLNIKIENHALLNSLSLKCLPKHSCLY